MKGRGLEGSDMTNAERLDRLASMVRQSEFLSVSQIMNEFGVSAVPPCGIWMNWSVRDL